MNIFFQRAYLLASSVLFFCVAIFCSQSSFAGITSTTITDTSGYQLVWSDEFDSSAIDTNHWNFETGGDGWGNNEQEYYTAGKNVSFEGGNLVITAKKEAVGKNGYTSSRITTQGKKEFTFGRIEARMKLPVGQGLWPAFWMLGANIGKVGWPISGETDIMEHINADSIIYGTLHWNENGHKQDSKSMSSTPSSYHVYGIEWTPAFIKWYVDDSVYHTTDITPSSYEAFRKPSYILFNFAVGGNWPGQTVDTTLFPAKMYVDWVRVYQKK